MLTMIEFKLSNLSPMLSSGLSKYKEYETTVTINKISIKNDKYASIFENTFIFFSNGET